VLLLLPLSFGLFYPARKKEKVDEKKRRNITDNAGAPLWTPTGVISGKKTKNETNVLVFNPSTVTR
jgi:hypothetical protein